MLGKLNSHKEINEIGPLFYTIHKNQLKWIKDLNVRPETVKLLEENIGGKLLDTGVGNDFLDLMPEAKVTKAKSTSGTTSN